MQKRLTDEQLCSIYRIPNPTLRSIKNKGADIYDARSVIAIIRNSTRKPDEWKDFFEVGDTDSHEYWKKEKTKEEVERLRLANAKSSGEMFDRVDGESVMVAWVSALKLSLAELLATLPPQLAGLDEAGVESRLADEFHKMQANLGDLESELWKKVYDKYSNGTADTPADGEGGGGGNTSTENNSQRVVPPKRQAGPRTRAKP
jgi:hypothetical protein